MKQKDGSLKRKSDKPLPGLSNQKKKKKKNGERENIQLTNNQKWKQGNHKY